MATCNISSLSRLIRTSELDEGMKRPLIHVLTEADGETVLFMLFDVLDVFVDEADDVESCLRDSLDKLEVDLAILYPGCVDRDWR